MGILVSRVEHGEDDVRHGPENEQLPSSARSGNPLPSGNIPDQTKAGYS
jgi:hypothetical protein